MKKKIVSLILALNAVMVFGAASAFADSFNQGNIKYDYADNQISSTDVANVSGGNQELTMIVVKGDKTAANATFTNADVVAVEQTEGLTYQAAMQDLGVKLENGNPLEQGIYTVITSGETAPVTKELLILGDANGITAISGKDLGEVRDITISNVGSRWSYACVCTVGPSNISVLMQRYNGEKWQYAIKNLSDFHQTNNDTLIDAKVDVGFQVNEFTSSPADVQFSVIPFNN